MGKKERDHLHYSSFCKKKNIPTIKFIFDLTLPPASAVLSLLLEWI